MLLAMVPGTVPGSGQRTPRGNALVAHQQNKEPGAFSSTIPVLVLAHIPAGEFLKSSRSLRSPSREGGFEGERAQVEYALREPQEKGVVSQSARVLRILAPKNNVIQ